MEKKVRLGYIGLGRRGYNVLAMCVSKMKDVEVVAVCDIDPEKFAAVFGLMERREKPAPRTYTDYRLMLRHEALDGVMIMTGWNQRLIIAMDAMEAGVYTAIEVGCAYDLSQCFELVKCYERTGTPVMMLENCCYGRQEMGALAMARAGMFGQIVLCTGGYHHDLREADLLRKKEDGSYDVNHYRMAEYVYRNCEQYPTHELGPISKLLNINRGNRMLPLRSIPSAARGLREFTREHLPKDSPYYDAPVAQSDIITTIIDCAGGEQIIMTLDTSLPRVYYTRNFGVRGTKGAVESITDTRSTWRLDGMDPVFDNEKEWLREHDHPLYKEYKDPKPDDGHGGIDWLTIRAFVESIRRGIETPIDAYDTALWLAIAPLSEMSIAQGGAPVPVPDFTNGRWFCREKPVAWKYSLDLVCEEPDTPIIP